MKYKPTLYVNTSATNLSKAIEEEIGRYSITPTTLESRNFFNTTDDHLFVDQYRCGKNSVERYGLNINSSGLLKEVEDYNLKNHKATLVAPSIASTNTKDAVKNANTIKDQKLESQNILTKLEYHNTNLAIKQCQSGYKAVLVDVFERDANNNINVDQTSLLPKTHTVVLYEQLGKYLVIDPSNATFSHVLSGAHDDIRLCFSNKLQIYKGDGKNIGPLHDQWRDCIDIAVKLAFNLNVNFKLGFDTIKVTELGGNIGYIDFPSIKESAAIREITNQKESIYKKLYDVVSDHPIRLKQSSEVVESKKATALLTTLESVSAKLSDILKEKGFIHSFQALEKQEKSLVDAIFAKPDYKECLKNSIHAFAKELDAPFYNIIKDEVELLATEFSYIDQI